MTQLTRNMYGSEFRRTGDRFGLACGQMRSGRIAVHNGGWYNSAGEKLGWGDLSVDDLVNIAIELEKGEVFIVLHERASFWNFVTRPGMLGSDAQTSKDVEAPGLDYVAEHAVFIIAECEIFVPTNFQPDGRACPLYLSKDKQLNAAYVSSENVKAKIAALAAV